MKMLFLLWFVCICALFFPVSNTAQTLNKPQNVRNIWGIEGNNCTFQWNIVPGATGYRIDVANDSLFTDMLPGLTNLPVLQHRILQRTYPPRIVTFPPTTNVTSATVWGLPFSAQYYCRIRAINSTTSSENSTTLTLSTAPRNSCLVLETTSVRDSSIELRWRIGQQYEYSDGSFTDNVNVGCATKITVNASYDIRYHQKPQESICPRGAFNVPNYTNILTTNTLQVQGSSVVLRGLKANTPYAIGVFASNGINDGICEITTLPNLYAANGQAISLYEGPLAHRISSDSSEYYSRNDTTTTLESALNLVQQVRSMGIAVDTMWFHASIVPILSGRIFVPLPDGNIDPRLYRPQVCGFTIKLRQKDDRVLPMGFANRVGFWEYADNLMFYRYVFSGITSVQAPAFALNTPLALAPNPGNGELTTLYYSLPHAAETTVTIVNLLGQTVYEEYLGMQREGPQTATVPLPHLPNGMYRVCLSVKTPHAALILATQALTIMK